jgi:diguanylate cyclase (GGDEF)-like protein
MIDQLPSSRAHPTGSIERAEPAAVSAPVAGPDAAPRAAWEHVVRDSDNGELVDVLAEFARTMSTNFSIQTILDHLVGRIADVLPIDAAGITLIAPDISPHFVAASDALALRFEELQSTLGDGPCVATYRSGVAVAVPDLSVDVRFPVFGPLALAAGMAAVFTFPLRSGAGQIGALDLYRKTVGPLDEPSMGSAQVLADVAAAYLVNARTRADLVDSAAAARQAALHDPLTGLPNRLLFMDRLQHAIDQCDRAGMVVTVLYIDLDDFKTVNDTFGHTVGDEMLGAVAERLVQYCRPADTVARLAGDEFAVMCEHLTEHCQVDAIAERIRSAFQTPFQLSNATLVAGASVGVAFTDSSSTDAARVLNEADVAMYQAKRRGGGQHTLFDHTEHDRLADRATLRRDLVRALAQNEFSSAYQPIVSLATGQIVEFEALLRWTHPVRGPVPPDLAIQLAEESGLIHEIGRLMLARACVDRRGWAAAGSPGIRVAVNVSAHELMLAGFSERVADILLRTDTDPMMVTLEVTETAFVHDSERALAAVCDLKRLGVRISLDDFGTGYSSLSYLVRFPIDVVKIDRSFVSGLGVDRARERIVEAVVSLAHGLGMTVVAEGVETEVQRAAIEQMTGDFCQGFLYSQAVAGADVARVLAQGGVGAGR